MGKRELGTIPGPLLPAAASIATPWKLPLSGLGAGEATVFPEVAEADWPTEFGAAKVVGAMIP